ncbi:MAG: ATP-binding protein, partial [Clostridium sp.]
GAGQMNRYKAFKWNKEVGLIGIDSCDAITFNELIGYERQKNILIKNTEAFLNGKEANNVLLFGDSGTGKSSSVKALLNKYYNEGLRLLELNKSDFMDLNKIISCIGNRGVKFILFLDDLSFEEFESEYKNMKALIEGGVEVRPSNVLIYATSNRRHLIRENWSDREGQDMHVAETMQEKYSLAERFGITLTYVSTNQKEYLNTVYKLAAMKNISMPEEELKLKALQWSASNSGRSGRIAKQFITSINNI